MRSNDESVIHRLKERITQLGAENSDLLQQVKGERIPDDQYLSHKEMELQDEISKLKDLLATANAKIDHQTTFRKKSTDTGSESQIHRLELEKLRNEFDQYKQKVQDTMEKKQTNVKLSI
jgi:signal transduction protein with GAF and PtsI domain